MTLILEIAAGIVLGYLLITDPVGLFKGTLGLAGCGLAILVIVGLIVWAMNDLRSALIAVGCIALPVILYSDWQAKKRLRLPDNQRNAIDASSKPPSSE